jgi:peptide-methionine (S)-S-oxide reductase
MRIEALFTVGMIVGLGVVASMLARGSRASGGPAPVKDPKTGLFLTPQAHEPLPPTATAAFSAGCFWGVEEEFRKEPGVLATAVGYSGGHTKDPSYQDVCTDRTGHAETVKIAYDPRVVTYDQLLDLFWHLHDPTTLNRQGPDVGEQYRSIVFYFTPEQQRAAQASREKLQASGEFSGKIVTEIVPEAPFYFGEDYHQQYVQKGGVAHCHIRRHKS